MNPAFSIVIPLYNKENYILETLSSVFSQEYPHYEVIVVDDGSTDKSLELVRSLNNHDINIICHDKNKGLSAARNSGIKEAKNPYITFLDADDYWHSDYLTNIKSLIIQHPSEQIFGTSYQEDYNGKTYFKRNKLITSARKNISIIDDFFSMNLSKLIITQSSLTIHKDVFSKIGLYNSKITFAEDIEFYIRCFSEYSLVYIDTPLVTKKIVTGSLSNSLTFDKCYPDLEKYYNKTQSLDNFIHFYLYCFCRRKKNEGDYNAVNQYRKKLVFKKLSILKIVMIYSPQPLYLFILKVKLVMLKKLGLNLTSY
jgi:glycosyltransferase involved in cell wall biosynthesis